MGFVQKPEGKSPLGKPSRRWNDLGLVRKPEGKSSRGKLVIDGMIYQNRS